MGREGGKVPYKKNPKKEDKDLDEACKWYIIMSYKF
jgi:hypothetical protein